MKINKNLLKQLYLIQHPSNYENDMMSFIINYCYKIPNLTFYIDHYSNIFITKNSTNPQSYSCLIAHTDEALTYKYEKEIVDKHPWWYGKYVGSKKQCALGADDANGIYVILHLLEVLPNLKCVFTVEEELGCLGAEQAVYNVDFFKDCQYFIQADRRGKSDLITFSNCIQITSEEFVSDIKFLMNKYGYQEREGIYTDVGIFVRELNLSGINVSCGYYDEHTMRERTNIDALENCLNFIYDIIIELGYKVYPHDANCGYPETYLFESVSDEDAESYYARKEREALEDNRYYIPCDDCLTYDCMNCNLQPSW